MKYDPKNIDKALKRMEDMDTLKGLGSQRSATNIMSFFDDIDEEYELQKQKSAAEVKKEEYLQSHQLLSTIITENGTKNEMTRIRAFGLLIETTNFLTIDEERKTMIKDNMEWCNEVYEKYVDTPE
jgi:hypothetical protein|tara:strand:+ start:2992 stop:3369 length:378 start_codon:yes stop_codon:yes gene_type:complete